MVYLPLFSSNTELMTMIAVEYYALGEYNTSLQMAGHILLQIPAEEKSTLESVAPKQVILHAYLKFKQLFILFVVPMVCRK